jgi:hypothetical protein
VRHGEGAMAVAPGFYSPTMGMVCGGRWRGEGGYVEVIGALRIELRSWRGLGLPWRLRFGITNYSGFRTMVPGAVARARATVMASWPRRLQLGAVAVRIGDVASHPCARCQPT